MHCYIRTWPESLAKKKKKKSKKRKRSELGSAKHGLIDSAFRSIDPVPEMVRINEAQSSVAPKNKKAGAATDLKEKQPPHHLLLPDYLINQILYSPYQTPTFWENWMYSSTDFNTTIIIKSPVTTELSLPMRCLLWRGALAQGLNPWNSISESHRKKFPIPGCVFRCISNGAPLIRRVLEFLLVPRLAHNSQQCRRWTHQGWLLHGSVFRSHCSEASTHTLDFW